MRGFDDLQFSRRIIGYDKQVEIERYIKRYCKEIEIIRCDDSVYASSVILLVPHPKHGITVLFIPQCTRVQNQFFLYPEHTLKLLKALNRLNKK